MPENMQALQQIVGFVVTFILPVATAGAVVAYWLFKIVSEKWLSAKFDERLEKFRHTQQQELEALRYKIGALLDRATKLHQHEFEVLPEVWARLVDALAKAQVLTSRLQRVPDLDGMSRPEFVTFVSECKLDDWQKKELLSAEAKTKYFRAAVFRHDYADVVKSVQLFREYSLKQGVFLEKPLSENLHELDELIANAIEQHRLNEAEGVVPRSTDMIDKMNKRGSELFEALELEIRRRLRNTTLE